MVDRSTARAAAPFAGILFGLASAQALECPLPQPSNAPGVIKETPAEIAELAPVLVGADVTTQIPSIVDGLKKRYPGAGSAELANYLITAYCPGVAKAADLSDAEKTARVNAFSKAVLGVLY
jgi:hypothetical protein